MLIVTQSYDLEAQDIARGLSVNWFTEITNQYKTYKCYIKCHNLKSIATVLYGPMGEVASLVTNVQFYDWTFGVIDDTNRL